MKIHEIAEYLGGELSGNAGPEILRVASIEGAGENDISFIEKAELLSEIENMKASCLIVPENFFTSIPCPVIKVKNPKLSFAKVAEILHPPKSRKFETHSTALIADTAKIGHDVFIGAFACVGENSVVGNMTEIHAGTKIGDNVKIGTSCTIHPNVFIEDNSIIGNHVILHAGVIIGADGFGFVRDGANGYIKFPQIGKVIVEDSVEIGANSCVDRGALGDTRIGKGTKIDNLVQIAHNVKIGERVVIAAQTGISGSTIIEDDCVIGGQVGMGDHATVKSGAIIGSQAGVLPHKIVRNGIWWGTPVQPLDDFKRQNALVKGLSRIRDEIKELKKHLAEIKLKID